MTRSSATASATIYKAQRIISDAGREINAALGDLDELLKSVDHAELRFKPLPFSSDVADESEWITLATTAVYRAEYRDQRKRPKGALSFIVDLGSGKHGTSLADRLEEAVMIVGWGDDSVDDPWRPEHFEFPIEAEWLGDDESDAGWLVVEAGGLVRNHHRNHPSGDDNGDWWFAYPLHALKEPEDLQNLLISPAIRLLEGMPAEMALQGPPEKHLIRLSFDEANALVPAISPTESL